MWTFGYKGLGSKCEQLDANLANVRPIHQSFVKIDSSVGPEHGGLTRYAVPPWSRAQGPRPR